MKTKLTLGQRMVNHVAAHGPCTRKDILTAVGAKVTSFGSYFAPVTERSSPYRGKADYDAAARASLVASGRLSVVGKNAKRELLYVLGPAGTPVKSGGGEGYSEAMENITYETLFNEEHYIDGVCAYALGAQTDLTNVPEPVRSIFARLLDEAKDAWEDAAADEDEDEAPTYRVAITPITNEPGAWALSVHEEGAPFNPSGHEFFFRGDGTYIGYIES